MNKYLRWFLLKWIAFEKKFYSGGDKRNRLTQLELGIENINKPYLITQLLQSKRPNEKWIEHYVPIDWLQRRIDFLDPAGIPEETIEIETLEGKTSREWAAMDRETFLDTANPLTEDEQWWADLDGPAFYAMINFKGKIVEHPDLHK